MLVILIIICSESSIWPGLTLQMPDTLEMLEIVRMRMRERLGELKGLAP